MTVMALAWRFNAKVVPLVVGSISIVAILVSLANQVFRRPPRVLAEGETEIVTQNSRIHMDLESDTAHLPVKTIIQRAGLFFGYLIAFMFGTYLIGLITTLFFFVIGFMRHEAKERWSLVLPYAVCMVIFVTIVFDHIMAIPWPQSVLGDMFPILRDYIPSV
jgi:hypothetical protein